MANVRKTISISTTLDAKAEALRVLLDHPDFSSLMQDLIRREYERRQGPAVIANEPAPPYRTQASPAASNTPSEAEFAVAEASAAALLAKSKGTVTPRKPTKRPAK